ncbi:MAG: helix-turn-helix domain-containing protein, partial [Terracoccus sp.]
PDDQSAMVTHALESLVNGGSRQIDVDLPSGARARMQAQSVGEGEKGTVVSVSLAEAWSGRRPNIEHPSDAGLPGIVGTDPVWAHCCREVEAAARNDEWLVVRGERGVGKLAVLRAVHLRLHPGSQVTVLDAAVAHTASGWAAELSAALDGSSTGLVITHAEALDVNRLNATADALQRARATNGSELRWVATTLAIGSDELNLLPLLGLFPRTVDVPPLRLHLRDLPLLVPHLLRRVDPHGHLTYPAEVIATMMRGSWTGNVTELDGVLHEIAAHRRSGEIVLEDLPPAARTVSRRRLTHIEALERDAVVAALQQAHGDKTRAAKALGMSRATIYRKIRDYGILAPVRAISQG